MIKKVLIPLLILISANMASGQCTFEKFAVNPKLGIFNASNSGGLLGGIELYKTHDWLLYSVDYYYFEELDFVFGSEPGEYYNQIGLMIGKYRGERLFRFQIQGGVAPSWGQRRTKLINKGVLFSGDKYDHEKFVTAGLVVKLGFKLLPLDFLSVGIDLQTNINPKSPLYMAMISLEFGKLRTN